MTKTIRVRPHTLDRILRALDNENVPVQYVPLAKFEVTLTDEQYEEVFGRDS